ETLPLELRITDRENLVDHQNLRLQVGGDRERQSHVHAAGKVFNGRVDELFNFGKGHDLVELPSDFASAHPENGAVEKDVLPPRQFGVKAGPDLQERPDAAVNLDTSLRGLGDPRQNLE